MAKNLNKNSCAEDIYTHGEVVCITANISSANMNVLASDLAEVSGQKVDWHFVAGRGVVKVLGDAAKVRELLEFKINTLFGEDHNVAIVDECGVIRNRS